MRTPTKNHVVAHVKALGPPPDEWTHSMRCYGVTVDGVPIPGEVRSVQLGKMDGSADTATVMIELSVGKFETTDAPFEATS